jgi:hypothetical protein
MKICTSCEGTNTQDDGGERGVCTNCWGDPALLCDNCGCGACDCDAIAAQHEDSDERAYQRAHLPEVA